MRTDVVVINAGLKSEGIVPIEQFRNDDGEIDIAEGDIVLQAAGIMAHYAVPADVEQSYYQNTSGLQIVSGAAAQQILQG